MTLIYSQVTQTSVLLLCVAMFRYVLLCFAMFRYVSLCVVAMLVFCFTAVVCSAQDHVEL